MSYATDWSFNVAAPAGDQPLRVLASGDVEGVEQNSAKAGEPVATFQEMHDVGGHDNDVEVGPRVGWVIGLTIIFHL